MGVSCCGNERIGWSIWLGVFGRDTSWFTLSETIGGGGGQAGGTGTLLLIDGAGGGGGAGANSNGWKKNIHKNS